MLIIANSTILNNDKMIKELYMVDVIKNNTKTTHLNMAEPQT